MPCSSLFVQDASLPRIGEKSGKCPGFADPRSYFYNLGTYTYPCLQEKVTPNSVDKLTCNWDNCCHGNGHQNAFFCQILSLFYCAPFFCLMMLLFLLFTFVDVMERTLVKVALGIGVVGTVIVNIGYRRLQNNVKNRECCTMPLKALAENQHGIQLLGGTPIKVKDINLRKAELNENRAKLTIPVEGNTRKGEIYALLTRENIDTSWFLQYAVMKISQRENKWIVWLHPTDNSQVEISKDIQQSIL